MSREVAPDGEDVWASPPEAARGSERRVSVAAHKGAEVWLTAPPIDTRAPDEPVVQSVDPIEVVEPGPPEPEPTAGELAPSVELMPSVELVPSVAVNAADDPVELHARLTISLEPEWPGNVHVYEITIDTRDGTFSGFATQSSNIPGETICGVFGDGFADIDFTAAYPTPGYHYAWFGSGPLHGLTASDSLGNVLRTVSATVAELTELTDSIPTDEPTVLRPELIAVDAPFDRSETEDAYDEAVDTDADDVVIDTTAEPAIAEAAEEIDEPPVAPPVLDLAEAPEDDPADAVVAPEEPEEPSVPGVPRLVPRHRRAVRRAKRPAVAAVVVADVVTEEPVAEPLTEAAVAADEILQFDVVAEVAPEPLAAEVVGDTPADTRDHPVTCECLACRWAAFEPVPVTEGPLAGKAFYFRAGRQDAAS